MITRFAEHVAQEVEAGRFSVSRGYFDNEFYVRSPEYGMCRVHDPIFKTHFSFAAEMRGWPWNRKKTAFLSRGHECLLPITQEEHDRLYDVYQLAKRVDKERKAQKALENEAYRQRLTDWP